MGGAGTAHGEAKANDVGWVRVAGRLADDAAVAQQIPDLSAGTAIRIARQVGDVSLSIDV